MKKKFPVYNQLNLPQINKEVLNEWDENDLFAKSMSEREGAPSFVFFEGPPSANGMPGIHHVMARSIKDTFCRFKTMKGFQVKRKAGWDTHGLPVELGVEKKLNITKEDIGKKISVDDYNRNCREEVMKYTKEWTDLTRKMGYWVDLDNPYIRQQVHGDIVVAVEAALQQRPALQRLYNPALLACCRYRTQLARAQSTGLLP